MIRIKIYDVEHGQTDTGFHLDVPAVPRVGEFIDIHYSLCGEYFLNANREAFGDEADWERMEESGVGNFIVVSVKHFYAKNSQDIEVGLAELVL